MYAPEYYNSFMYSYFSLSDYLFIYFKQMLVGEKSMPSFIDSVIWKDKVAIHVHNYF